MFEWAVSIVMTKIGLGVFIALWLDVDISQTFTVFVGWGLSADNVGMLFLIVGSVRCYALYANGQWHRYGCYTRAAGSAIGVIIWMQLFVGVLEAIAQSKLLYVGIFVWSTFSIFDFFSLCRSILDCAAYRVSGNAARAA